MAETEIRPLILELGQKITDRLGRKINENDPEYWGLNVIVADLNKAGRLNGRNQRIICCVSIG